MKRSRQWRIRDDYRSILVKTKKLFPSLLKHVVPDKVLLCSFVARRSRHIAKIRRNSPPWNLAAPHYDFCIEFWATRYDAETESYKLYVMLHELLHIPRGGFNPKVREYRKLLDHDLEDFMFLRSVYGLRLGKVQDVLKGERSLIRHSKENRRFPRLVKMG